MSSFSNTKEMPWSKEKKAQVINDYGGLMTIVTNYCGKDLPLTFTKDNVVGEGRVSKWSFVTYKHRGNLTLFNGKDIPLKNLEVKITPYSTP